MFYVELKKIVFTLKNGQTFKGKSSEIVKVNHIPVMGEKITHDNFTGTVCAIYPTK